MALENALINMYGKCEAPVDAEKTFYNMQEHNIISWNTMIAAYGQSCDSSAALKCFQLMQLEDLAPDKVSFINLLHACSNVLNLVNGKQIHAYILKSRGDLMDLTVGTSLVNMYGKCSSLENAWRVFQKIALKNLVAWNTMMAVYAQNGHAQETFQLFQQMQLEEIKPDRISFVSIFDACAKSGSLVKARLMHAQAITGGFITDVIIENAIVHMYGQCSCPEGALDAFQRIISKDTISWNAIIGALGQNGYGMETFSLFQQIQLGDAVPDRITYITMFDICSTLAALSSGKYMHSMVICSGLKYDVVIGTALVSMYGKCASVVYAYRLFSQLSDRNVVLWNAMLSVYTQTGYDIDALELFECMPLEEVVPDTATFASILGACANLAALTKGKELHAYVKGTGFECDLVVMNAFLNMYGKCGSTEIAQSTFSKMLERDIISWNAMIAAHGQNGFVEEAFGLFHSMQIDGIFPVDLTFISILSACSHAGLVAEGCHHFISMSQHHDITQVSKHYNCVVDLLGRVGWLDEAQDLIDIVLNPGGDVYLTLLGASKVHGDMIKAYNAAKQVFLLDPENVGAHVSLSNIYAAYGL